VFQQIAEKAGHNAVQHDGPDHDVDVTGDVQNARHGCPRSADSHRYHHDKKNMERCWEMNLCAGCGSQNCGQSILTFHTDVEDVHFEADGNGQARDEKRQAFVRNDSPESLEKQYFNILLNASSGLRERLDRRWFLR
jgi:hypothetical protein